MTRAPDTLRRGFSLIELMVVVAILAIITGQILAIFSSQLRTYAGQKAALETQDDARLAADLLFADSRMAGFMIPPVAGLSAVDGGNAAADILCLSDPSIMDDAEVEQTLERFDGTALAAAVGAGVNTADLDATDLDVDGDGDDDFAVGSGIILVDGINTHCARITAIAGGTFTFTPRTPVGYAATTAGIAVPAVVYELNNGLLRNNLLISRHVEDLQVEFGIDLDDDGQIAGAEFPIHGLFGQDATLVKRVQLSVLARTAAPDETLTGQGRQQVANRAAAGVADNFRRRLITASATPRNML